MAVVEFCFTSDHDLIRILNNAALTGSAYLQHRSPGVFCHRVSCMACQNVAAWWLRDRFIGKVCDF